MPKHLTILCLFIALAAQSTAQVNLVPNPSFENYYIYSGGNAPISAPTDSSFIYNRALNWFAAKGSPDIFTYHNLSTGPISGCINASPLGWDIPENLFGFQYPRTDSCYMGLAWADFLENLWPPNNYKVREWAGVRLLDTLRKDQCYRFSMYISPAENSGYQVNALGAYFSKDSLFSGYVDGAWVTPPLIELDSIQVLHTPDSTIGDTSIWTLITGVFEAKGNETFLYIGHLLPDSNNVVIPIYPNVDDHFCNYSYYFIDDVSVYETNEPCKFVGVNEIKKEHIKIYPNPAAENFTITLPPNTNKAELLIYTVQGQLLSQTQITSTQTINTNNHANGLYLFVIQLNGSIVGREKVVIAH